MVNTKVCDNPLCLTQTVIAFVERGRVYISGAENVKYANGQKSCPVYKKDYIFFFGKCTTLQMVS